MRPIAEMLKDNWLVSILLVCAAVAATTWKVSDEVFVKPRDFRIDVLQKQHETDEKQISQLQTKIDRKEKEIADSTKAALMPPSDNVKNHMQEPKPGELVVDFPWVDTASVPDLTVAAAPYLHGVGISVTELQPQQSEVVLKNNRNIYGGLAIIPTTSQNILTQISTDINGPASFTLVFASPCDNVSFTRPALYAATKSGVTHPAWSAHALDAQGRELSSQSEVLTRSFSDVPLRTYTLNAPGFEGIAAVRFDSDWRLDGKPFAGFRAILIERLTLIRRVK